jgi:hypothetical protein
MAVLDLACGHRRSANRHAERGARATRLDATALFLDRAGRGVDVDVDYVDGDMRLLLIENNNLVELLPRWPPAFVTERDGHFAIDRSRFDAATGRATTERVIIRDGRTRRFVFSVRVFVAHRVPVEATVQRSQWSAQPCSMCAVGPNTCGRRE